MVLWRNRAREGGAVERRLRGKGERLVTVGNMVY